MTDDATAMNESLRSRLRRLRLNLHPAYWDTEARLTYLADDFHEVRLTLPLTWRTRNVVGTLFGGSMFGAVDPVYMLMLIRILGPEYRVWDKSAAIRFLRPGRETLYATFRLEADDVAALRRDLETRSSTERTYTVDLVNRDGVPHATVEKRIHIQRRRAVQPAGAPAPNGTDLASQPSGVLGRA